MAVVLRAHDVLLGRDVAVKVLRPELRFAGPMERFLQEIQITAGLSHPNILLLHDSGDAAGVLYYVMPYVPGGSLRDRLNREKQLPLSLVIDIAGQVAAALDYSHRQGIVHRDIKPENILFQTDRHALVADFGIARVLSVADTDRLSQYGLAVGTVPYMSPEQCAGNRHVDGRSDVYALACVVYEMLAGDPPFTGPTNQAISAKHLHERPPSLRIVRPNVPEPVQDAVETALAKVAADRFATAGEFASALRNAQRRRRRSVYQIIRHLDPRRVSLATGGALAAIILAWGIGRATVFRVDHPAPADTSRYVVFPFQHEPDVNRPLNEVQLLHDAMARWSGLSVVDPFQLQDALGQDSLGPPTQRAASRLAATLGAGRYVRGTVSRIGDSLRVQAVLYDSRDGRALADNAVRLGTDFRGADSLFALMADGLLFRGMLPAGVPALAGTKSLPARQAFARGQQALETWDLDQAATDFEAADTLDRAYAQAHLWLALARAWSDQHPAAWSQPAEQALLNGERLSERDRTMANAAAAQARGNLGRACGIWRGLTRRYALDFASWYGLAYCLRHDDVVVRDSASPSGLRFRSSYQESIQAYRRAFELRPTILSSFRVNAYEPVRRLLMTSRQSLRQGHALDPDTGTFSARVTWTGDSLMLVPYPIALTRGPGEPWRSESVEAAMIRQQELFRDIIITWATTSPRSSAAKEAVAVSLEMLGNPAAVDTFRRARSLALSREEAVRIGAGEVWMQVKLGCPSSTDRIRQAKALADSLLKDAPNLPGASRATAGLAALTGRAALAAALVRRAALLNPAGWLPPSLAGSAPSLLLFSSLGGPADSLRTLEQQLVNSLENPSLRDREELRLEWLGRPARLAAPFWRLQSLQALRGKGDYLIDAEAALAAGDTSSVRQVLARLQESRKTFPAADRAIDAAFPETVLFAALHDDQGAIAWLDPTLQNLQQAPPGTFNDPAKPGALVNAMALRADLAAGVSDAQSARRWAEMVAILWADADQFLQPVVRRMRALATR